MAMNAIAKLGIVADTKSLSAAEQSLNKFGSTARKTSGELDRASKSIQNMQKALGGLVALVGGGLAVQKIIAWGDAWTSASNSLRLVVSNQRELITLQNETYAIAQKTASKFEGITGLYAAIQRAAGDTIGSQKEVLRLTETISKLSAASGGPAGSRESALFQLRQALGGAVLQAQEFNSLIDGAPLIVDAIAKGFGRTRSEMKKLVNDGKADIPTVIKALQDAAGDADKLFTKIQFTVSDSFVRLNNALTQIVGQTAGPALKALSDAITALAMNLENVTKVAQVAGIALAAMFAPAIIGGAISLTDSFVKMAGNLAMASGSMATTTALSARLASVWESLQLAWMGLTAAIAANPLGAIATVLAAAAAAAVIFSDKINVATTSIKGLNADGTTSIVQLKVTLEDTLDAIPEVVSRNFDEAAKGLRAALKDWGDLVYDWMDNTFGDDFTKAFDDAMQAVGDSIRTNIGNALLTLPGGREAANLMNQIQAQAEKNVQDAAKKDLALRAMDQFNSIVKQARAAEAAETKARAAAAEEAAKKAAESAKKLTKEIQDQAAALNALFETLERAATLSTDLVASGASSAELEKQLSYLEDVENLLEKNKEYYASMKGDARALAEADAKRLAANRQIIAANRELAKINDTINESNTFAAAFTFSVEQYDLTKKMVEISKELPGISQEIVAQKAKELLAAERIADEIERQADRAREITRAPIQNFVEGLEGVSDDFWTNFVEDGSGAIDDLFDAFNDMFKRLKSDILRALFEPFRQQIMNNLGLGTGAVASISAGGMGNPALIAQVAASIANTSRSAVNHGGTVAGYGGMPVMGQGAGFGPGFNLGSLGGLLGGGGPGGGIGNLALTALAFAGGGGGGGNILQLGLLGGKMGLGNTLSNAISSIFGTGPMANQAAGFAGSLGSIFNAKNGLYGMAGSGLANLLGLGGGKGGSIGGSIGGVAGSFLGGPIGAAVGSFLGSAVGGLFKTGTSMRASAASLDASGQVSVRNGKNETEQTQQALNAAVSAVQQGMEALKALGATTKTSVEYLLLSENRNSQINLSNGQKLTAAKNDPAAAADAGLSAVLRDATFANKTLDALARGMVNAGQSFDAVVTALDKVNSVIGEAAPALSQWEQAIKTVNDALEPITAEARNFGESAFNEMYKALIDARAKVRDKFAESIDDSIKNIEQPIAQQFGALLESQVQRIKDATAVGSSSSTMAQVNKLNALEITNFIEAAGNSTESFAILAEQFDAMRKRAVELGESLEPLEKAFAEVKKTAIKAFNDSVGDSLEQLANPTLAALKSLLEQQKARLDQAKAIGADTIAVNRLNALEQQKFFEGLSDQQKLALGDYLGIIEDYTGQITITLSKLGNELSSQIDQFAQQTADLEKTRDAFSSGAQALGDLRQDLQDRFGGLTPMASVEALRSRFANLAGEAQGGNESALASLPQVAQQLIEASRNLYGSTNIFQNDLKNVDEVLAKTQESAQGRADAASNQLAYLETQVDLLGKINQSLQSSDQNLTWLANQLPMLQGQTARLLAQYLNYQNAQGNINYGLTTTQETAIATASAQAYGFTVPQTTSQQQGTEVAAAPAAIGDSGDNLAVISALNYQSQVTEAGLQLVVNEISQLRADNRRLYAELISRAG